MIDSYVKTKKGRQVIKAYSTDEIDGRLPLLNFKSQQKNHKITKYSTCFICLDTETSHKGQLTGWVYQWAAKIGGLYVYGRKPSEIITLLQTIAEHYHLREDKKIVLYIHNASYDLAYLKLFIRQYDPTASFLAIDAHHIIQVDVLGFKILCSYKLTNLSLNELSDKYATTYIKATGEIDYNIVRYQDQELTQSDWFYMFSDVAAQEDGINGYLKMQGYRYAYQAPITSTGFVRANCRKASKKCEEWRNDFLDSRLSLEQYNLCRQTFMGGVCIASFKYAGVTVRGDNLRHKDFTSSYPARQIINYFPRGRPMWYGDVETEEELNEILNEYCCVFLLTIDNVHIKNGITAPYIPSSKCIHIEEPLKINGKVVYAKTLTISVCEIDYKWICRQYDFDTMEIDKMLIFERGELPDWFKKEVMQYFKYKCTLRGVDDLLYMKSKNMLNAFYGMTATAIIRELFEMDDNYILQKKKRDEEAQEEALNKYYRSYNNFLPYQWCIWVTAHSRDALFTMIECVGYDNFLYCDTDSVFYIETAENAQKMEKYSEECRILAKNKKAFEGNKFLGEPTEEPKIRAFRALHSKCYSMEEWDKEAGDYKLNVVIAGIPKESTQWINGKPVIMTNAQELGNIDDLKDGFTFKHNGGKRCIYNEQPIEIKIIDGHEIELASSAIIESIEKEISENMYTNGEDYSALYIVQDAQ